MKTINRNDIQKDYKEMIEAEKHHDHAIVEINGILRWKENKIIANLLKNINLNDLFAILNIIGCGVNSEQTRKLYREMGYPLSGYCEIFYDELNNEDYNKYTPQVKLKQG